MFLTKAHNCFRKPSFEDELFNELYHNESQLPLQDFCRHGCPSGDDLVDLSDLQLNDSKENIVTGSLAVSFKEHVYRGCPDIEWGDSVSGRINFTLNLATGEITLEAASYPEREYERDEF